MSIYALSLFLALFIFNLLTFTLSVHDYKYNIGPVCECLDAAESLGDHIKTCYRRCLMDDEPTGRASIQLHQTMDSENGPSVVECSKIIQEQTFTRFWTFSTESSGLTHSFGTITREECQSAIASNCPSYNCNHREKDDLEPEYHYGSTTTVVRETISLVSMPSSLMFRDNKVMISPLSTPDLYDKNDGFGTYKNKIYLWTDKETISRCPFKEAQTYGCDTYTGSDKKNYYMCSQGRFSITPYDSEKDIAPAVCPGLKSSNEGFLYKLADVSASQSTNGRIMITQLQNMAGDVDYLRHKVQQSLTHLDSEICTNQCEILALESRVTSSRESVVRVGMTYFLMYHNGTATKCKTIHGCRLTSPRLFCGNPPRIGVTCATSSGLWDPLKPYVVPHGVCMKPDASEKLSFVIGSESYVVDDDLTISANSSFSHGVYPTSFSDLHQSGVQLKITDLQGMRGEWTDSKDSNRGISTSSSVKHKIESPQLAIGEKVIGWIKAIPEYIGSVEHMIGFAIMAVVIIASITLTIKLVKLLKRDKSHGDRRIYREINRNANTTNNKNNTDESAKWI